MKRIVFLGAYLSKTRGTKGPGEFVAEKLNEENFECHTISRRSNPLYRAIESISTVLFSQYDLAILEVYSSRVIYLSRLLSFLIRFRRKPYIAILHGGGIPAQYPVIRNLLDPILRNARRVVTPSNFIRQFFLPLGNPIQYLPNPFPIENFPYKAPDMDSVHLLWVRAFSSIYNPDLAVRILHEVRKTYPDATLTMVGPDKGELQPVQALINRLGLQKAVSITGPVPNEQLYQYFHSHSVYLNTTSYESFGVAVMEAAACGIPVVSTSVGEIPLLWQHGENILIADSIEPNQMAALVIRLIQEPELRRRLSEKARKKAEDFSWERIKPLWIKMLQL